MSNIISLAKYRTVQRKQYLQKNQTRLDRFIKSFVGRHLITSYTHIAEHYLSMQSHSNAGMWDYQDLRDIILDAIDATFGEELWREARAQFWFDQRYLNRDELVEYCFSQYIMAETAAATTM